MVALLNLLVFVVCLALMWTGWKTKKLWPVGCLALFLVVYPQIQPSYMPKGAVTRTPAPPFDPLTGEINDNNRKPIPSEVRNAEQERQYKEGLSFITK